MEGVSERVDRVLKQNRMASAMRPHTTIRHLLVHSKDKVELEELSELVYQIRCKSRYAAYGGETGRLFKTRLDEYKNEECTKRTIHEEWKETATFYHQQVCPNRPLNPQEPSGSRKK